MKALIPMEVIEGKILLIRGRKVMLDRDLAELYGVETFNLNKAAKRNIDRFPSDFMFQLTSEEADALRFQIGMSKTTGRGGRRNRLLSFFAAWRPAQCGPLFGHCARHPCHCFIPFPFDDTTEREKFHLAGNNDR
jgi:hypothetical protein